MTWNPAKYLAQLVAAELKPQFDALRKEEMIDTQKLDAQDAEILQTVAALGPLIQTAITDIGKVTASDAAGQAILDKHVASFQTVADGLTALQSSLTAAENPPATPAPPAQPPA